MPKDEVKITFLVDRSLKEHCDRIADSLDESLSQVLRRAMREYARQHAQAELPIARKKRLSSKKDGNGRSQ